MALALAIKLAEIAAPAIVAIKTDFKPVMFKLPLGRPTLGSLHNVYGGMKLRGLQRRNGAAKRGGDNALLRA